MVVKLTLKKKRKKKKIKMNQIYNLQKRKKIKKIIFL